MMVAVDTNILFDLVLPNQPRVEESYQLLTHYMKSSPLIICEQVYSELASVFAEVTLLDNFLNAANIRLVSTSKSALYLAGQAWRRYTLEKVTTRQHLIADFIIGAHALENANRLLARDRGIFERYFPDLVVQSRP